VFAALISILFRQTVQARLAAYSNASKQAEDARVQIRRHCQASMKKGKYAKHSVEHDEVSVDIRTAFRFP
jgi:hypothetical protein